MRKEFYDVVPITKELSQFSIEMLSDDTNSKSGRVRYKTLITCFITAIFIIFDSKN